MSLVDTAVAHNGLGEHAGLAPTDSGPAASVLGSVLEAGGASELAASRPQLRLVVAGSVDDGKSTLVGRLLYDTKSILADQYEAVEAASKRRGADAVDLALLTDGLRAEREQGITIDVAYRYFSTHRRSFILADTPGHMQYTRNTVTGASTADAALILVDARNGALVQTRRHAAVMALLQVPHVIFAVNKMDAIGWSQQRFDEVAGELRSIAARLGNKDVSVVPVSALTGQNVVGDSATAEVENDAAGAWYEGPSLLELLEDLDVASSAVEAPFRMPVQLVIRPRTAEYPDYRGLAGRIASGEVRVGDVVTAWPSGLSSVVTRIDTQVGPLPADESATAGESVTICLRDELDVGRGQVLTLGDQPKPESTGELVGVLCWLDERASKPNQRVLVKIGTNVVRGIITGVTEHWDVDTQSWADSGEPAELNDIVRVTIRLAEEVASDDYADFRSTGGFLVIDPAGGATFAAGMVGDPLARAFDPAI